MRKETYLKAFKISQTGADPENSERGGRDPCLPPPPPPNENFTFQLEFTEDYKIVKGKNCLKNV